ncbi:MAG: hypothetical protein J5J00_01985 [Deltaproteobacteria bacterium]|nr:hypothetical protein [Deltaproteobacteria bacterium]
MSSITGEIVQKVARDSGLSEKSVRRIVGSIPVPVAGKSGSNRTFDLGLRLEEVNLSSSAVGNLCSTIKEFGAACPVAVAWIGRGGFDPAKPPKELTYAKILHACRTAGRLRAILLRSR